MDPFGHEPLADESTPGQLLPRFLARLVDNVIIITTGILLAIFFGWDVVFGVELEQGAAPTIDPVRALLWAFVPYAYFVVLDATAGTTAGKRLLRLRVQGPGGNLPTIQQAGIREAFLLLQVIPRIGDLLGVLAAIVIAVTIQGSPTKQGKHDELAGGTRVVSTTALPLS